MIAQNSLLELNVEDLTGQVQRRVGGIPRDAHVGDVVAGLVNALGLPHQDAQGRSINYGVRTAAGDGLNATDIVGDVLKHDEGITVTKSVTAG